MSTPAFLPDEPVVARWRAHPARWFLATRPAFLTLTLGGLALGAGSVPHGALLAHAPRFAWGVALALLLHAAVNVLNDVADHLSGGDAANLARQFPFTGGSRMIQNGVLSVRQMRALGCGLLGCVVLGGVVLAWQVGITLWWIGVLAVVLSWGYSMPPLRLGSRGWGEACVFVCLGLLPIGSHVLLGGALSPAVLALALPYALSGCAVLFINQFPDCAADAGVGKRHWVVRLGLRRAPWGFLALVLAAPVSLLVAAGAGVLPWRVLVGAAPAGLLLLWAAQRLRRFSHAPARLRRAIVATVLAANALPWLLLAAIAVG